MSNKCVVLALFLCFDGAASQDDPFSIAHTEKIRQENAARLARAQELCAQQSQQIRAKLAKQAQAQQQRVWSQKKVSRVTSANEGYESLPPAPVVSTPLPPVMQMQSQYYYHQTLPTNVRSPEHVTRTSGHVTPSVSEAVAQVHDRVTPTRSHGIIVHMKKIVCCCCN